MDVFAALMPVLRLLPPETAHRLAIQALRWGLAPAEWDADDPRLSVTAFGLRFPNPVGLAAGFDKNAEAWRPARRLGFGFVEVGSVTPRPQPGNPRPRLFRLTQERAIINRMGFNNAGVEAMAARLRGRDSRKRAGILGINLGKNKETQDAAADYEIGARRLGPLADYVVINVSSPNTPGLRALQGKAPLQDLIGRTHQALLAACPGKAPPLLLKIAPDLTDQDLEDIAEVALQGALAGLIVTNTTIARPGGLDPRYAKEAGGLSGWPLFAPSTEILRRLYRLTQGRLPLIGVGGISSGADAYAKIRAGATLVQLYSALVYEGPGLVRRIKRDLLACLERDGLGSISAAIGLDHR
ncbi:MAG TPA: quinone-dependent dihydroorotate dehydrogenase [Dongiaceae bacterium]|nr:quinone-dependent dihydroorotate dehydrogenase [Dongiaceae bacterium]